ncbi:MAG TPA: two-component regulator propeller domain-containing protein [Pseudoxanthomonas sp.]|nr:two-component regulator propeller domain-containing protein [Pseudoxanthomonas sp.]
MRKPLRLIVLFIGLLAIHAPVAASVVVQPGYRSLPRIFTADDGLPQAGVNAVLQTRDGYLWVGTFGGLARFDGTTFQIFRTQAAYESPNPSDGQKSGPASDRILALHEDDEGRLWIGTEDGGLSVFEKGSFRHLTVCGGTCQINDILQGKDGAIWLASSLGVLRLEPLSQRETRVDQAGATGAMHLAKDGEGYIYAGGHDGLHIVSGQTLHSIPLPDGGASVQLLESVGAGLLVGTERELYRYDPALAQWRPLGVDAPQYAVEDLEGRWWVSQANGQVVHEDGAGWWKPVRDLAHMGITRLARDDEGNLWIGSGSKGLLRLRKALFGLLSGPQLGTNMAGRAVIADGKGGLWLGSACGGLRHWRRDGSMHAPEVRHVLGNDCISSLLLDRQGVLWIGSAAGGLARIVDGQPELVAEWPGGGAVNIWQDDTGRYLASTGRSTYELEIGDDGHVLRRRVIEALEGISIVQVVPAARGGHWFVGDYGVRRLIDDRIVEQWTPQEGLSSRFARALYEDDAGVLWVGTYGGGLNRIRNGQVRRYGTSNGLFDDTVSCILADGQGRLWLGGNRGATLLPEPDKASTTIESVGFTANDGLMPAEINGGTSVPCHRDTHGRLWFSLVEGFGVIDPVDASNARSAPLKTYIEHVAVAGQVQDITDSTLRLGSFARNLEIRFTAINLSRPRETQFRFRLSGFDRDWVEAGQNRSILYPTPPWGEHLFEVQARVEGGPWSPVPAKLQIVHPQPWYQRPWVWTVATVLGLLVLVGSTRSEKNQARPEGRQTLRPGLRRR